MSDFISSFWSYYIAIIALGGIVWCVYLLFSQRAWLKRDVKVVESTGHVWDGDLTELNNPVPRWWTVMYLLLCAFALGYLVLYPGLGSYKGTLGFTAGNQVLQEQEALNARIQPIYERFRDMPIPEIAKDAQARDIGQRLFLNNCAQCHGSDAKGGRGFPNLTDNDWLWGGLARSDPADHHQGPARHDAGLGCGHQTGRSIGHRPVRAFAVGPGA